MPTEAEWEYAARAGTTTAYSFGDTPIDLCRYGNGADKSVTMKHADWDVNTACDDGYADLAPVGRFQANRWGLFDMHGNVYEWVWDKHGTYPERSGVGYAGPTTSESNDNHRRVLRGGAFDVMPAGLRSAYRISLLPTETSRDTGLRCVRGSLPVGRSIP